MNHPRVMIVAPGSYGRHRAGFALRWRALAEALTDFERHYFSVENYASRMPESLSSPDSAREDVAARTELAAQLNRLRPDVVVVSELRAAAYIRTIRQASDAAVILDLHNVESRLKAQVRQAAAARGEESHYTAEDVQRVRSLEAWAINAADMIWACSDVDAATLRSMYHGSHEILTVPNVVRVPPATPRHLPLSRIAFVGALDYAPNAAAARFILDHVAPRLRATPADVVLAGRNPSQQLFADAVRAGVDVMENFRSFAEVTRDAALVVPLFEGSGTRFKILEAMAGGVPVVSTDIGIEGIDAEPNTHFLRAHTGDEFVAQAMQLLADPKLADRLRRAAFALAAERYSVDALRPVIRSAVNGFISLGAST
jgi:glycosyltransferase involved in cell wall biosynthesis